MLLDSRCPVLSHFVHAIKPGLQLGLGLELELGLGLSPPVREMVKLITIYIVYRPILRVRPYVLYSFAEQINFMLFNSIFKYFTSPQLPVPVTSSQLPSSQSPVSLSLSLALS